MHPILRLFPALLAFVAIASQARAADEDEGALPPALLGAWGQADAAQGEPDLTVVFADGREITLAGGQVAAVATARVDDAVLVTSRPVPGAERRVQRWHVDGETLAITDVETSETVKLRRLKAIPAGADLSPLPLGAADPDAARLAELRAELEKRFAADQAARQGAEPILAGGDPAKMAEVTARMHVVDTANTAWLREVVAKHGWIDRKRFGDHAADQAWFLVQHSMDLRLMQAVLARIEPEAAGDANRAALFAMLFDRTEMQLGRGQRYASQAAMVQMPGAAAGRPRVVVYLDDPDHVDARRAKLGLPTLGMQYGQQLARGVDYRVLPWPPAVPAAEDTPPALRLSLFKGWAEAAPADPMALNSYAWELLTSSEPRLRDPAAALPVARRAVEAGKRADPDVLDTLALAQRDTGDAAGAVVTEREAISKLPANADERRRAEFDKRLAEFTAQAPDGAAKGAAKAGGESPP